LAPYIAPSDRHAWPLFLATLGVYGGAAYLAGFSAAPLWLRVATAVVAGLAIPSLFVIGHDAAHGAFTARRGVNALIGRVAFLPALHNFSLWRVAHNKLHHRVPNLRGRNSWSPLSLAEYRGLSRRQKIRERLNRSILGFAPYYLTERWWRDKFFPRRHSPIQDRATAWRDFALLCLYFVTLIAALSWSGGTASVLLGFVVPFLIWNMMMGATTYLQHTDRRAPWFASEAEWRESARDEEITVHLAVPRWYGLISHHVMDHPAHHLQPKIPLYRLAAAQTRLNELLGQRAVVARFSPRYLFDTVRACKLYDYDSRCWLDFVGNPTSESLVPALSLTRRADAA
jgi:acyl-lipid omega-6 desaturase (Delta-12 desaturase)